MIKTIINILAIVSICFGTYFFFEDRYLRAEEFRIFAQTTQYELKSNQIEKLNERIWQLRERVRNDPRDKTAVEDLYKIGEVKKQYEKQLEEIGKKK